jgi:hypothetical protein
MKLLSSRSSAFFVIAAGVAAAGAQAASAAESERGVFAPRHDFCAAYGPGFVPVVGTRTCVRVSGHIRVEMEVERPIGFEQSSSLGAPSALTAVSSPEGPLQR